MAPQIAATLLQNHHGGKGILLGGVPRSPTREVVIIGAGAFVPLLPGVSAPRLERLCARQGPRAASGS